MAIARDAFTNGAFVSGTSRTFSHTCSGSDRILFVHAFHNTTADLITGATYGGTAMTLVAKFSPGGSRYLYLFALINPATGANDVVISASSSTAIGGNAFSYTGVSQTGQPEVYATDIDTASTINTSITTITDNSWIAMVTLGNNEAPTASTGATLYGQNSVYNDADVFDSNGTVSTGSNTMTVTTGGGSPLGRIIVAIAPSGGSPTNTTNFFLMMN